MEKSALWMTTELMKEWLQVFYEDVGKKTVLLLMYNFSAHRSAILNYKSPANIEIAFLPLRSTRVYQPLDLAIIYNAKYYYLKHVLKEQLRFNKSVNSLRAPTISLKDTIWWFHRSWIEDVKVETIQNCFHESTLFKEDLTLTEFTYPESSREFAKLYNEVVSAGGIDDPVQIQDFINPVAENVPPVDITPSISQLILWHLMVTEEEETEETRCVGEQCVVKWKNSAEMLHHVMEDMNHSNEYTDEMRPALQGSLLILTKLESWYTRQSTFTALDLLQTSRPRGLSGGSRTVDDTASVIAIEDLQRAEFEQSFWDYAIQHFEWGLTHSQPNELKYGVTLSCK